MIGKRDLFVGFLTGCCVMALLFAILPTKSTSDPNYNPWADLNDDGVIDSTDLGMMGGAWGSFGDPMLKASLLYDSGWINLTGETSETYTLTHNLNLTITGKIVDARQKTLENLTYGGASADITQDLVQTSDGGYALAGATSSFSVGGYDFWLVKTDAYGNIQWNMSYGVSTCDDVAESLIQTSDGGYALAGRQGVEMDYDFADVWLVKTDPNGNMQWNKTFGKEYPYGDMAYDLVQTGDGGYAVAGLTYSFGAGEQDCWLIKTDADGNELWNRTYGGIYGDWACSLVQTSDGGYALAGGTESFTVGGSDAYVVKTDANGVMEWNQRYGGANDDMAWDLVKTGDGGYMVAGTAASFGVKPEFYLFRTGPDGNMWWNKTYGAGDGQALVQTSDGGYALAGQTSSPPNYRLIKTDADGNEQWNRTYVGYTDWFSHCGLVQTSDHGYALAGSLLSPATSLDSWLIKTDASGERILTESGLIWTCSSSNTITLHKRTTDQYWCFVRVQIRGDK